MGSYLFLSLKVDVRAQREFELAYSCVTDYNLNYYATGTTTGPLLNGSIWHTYLFKIIRIRDDCLQKNFFFKNSDRKM